MMNGYARRENPVDHGTSFKKKVRITKNLAAKQKANNIQTSNESHRAYLMMENTTSNNSNYMSKSYNHSRALYDRKTN